MAPVLTLAPAVMRRAARPGPGGRPPGVAFPGRDGGGALLAMHGGRAEGGGTSLDMVASGNPNAAGMRMGSAA